MADIIQIDSLKLKRVHKEFCQHINMSYDPLNEYVGCSDCGIQLQPFKAFMLLIDGYTKAVRRLDERRSELKEMEDRSELSLLKATRKVDRAWRRKSMLPCCPHCSAAIAPEDGFGDSAVSKKMEMERRRFKQSGGYLPAQA